MAKVAVLVPYPELCAVMRPLIGLYPYIHAVTVEYTPTDGIAARAAELEKQGCELIIARGVHARLAKHAVQIPIVEMRVTTQELGVVLLELKKDLGDARPHIGVVGFNNMLGDTTRMGDLFGVDLSYYLVERSEELAPAVEEAQHAGCRAVVGGDIVCDHAKLIGMPHRFIAAGTESIKNALDIASRVCYAIDLEKRSSAEMDTMLGYTFSGIMQVDRSGVIRRVNRAGYDLLGEIPGELIDRSVTDALPNLSQKVVQDALYQGKEAYAFLLDIRHKAVVMNIAPIKVDGDIDGAILTFQEGRRIIEMDSELRRELYQRGFIARYSFDKLVAKSRETQDLIRLAKRMSKYSAPILLMGEAGSGKAILAQCIHNESLLRGNAFVPVDCSAWLPETLDNHLFGNYSTRRDNPDSMAELAQDGTLYLSHIEALPSETQYKLLNLIRGRFWHNGANRPAAANVRVIASSDVNLIARIEKGEFRSDLYYALSVLSLELLPLRRRREDIPGWVEFYLGEWQEKYKRYVRLTQDASEFMQAYDWPGNLEQMSSVCERIVLLTEKHSIDEVFLRRQLEQVTPNLLPGTEKVVLYKDRRAVEIAELLHKYGGNREKVAAELGVSKTTLWRYIKKYGIEPDYTY